MTRPKSSGAANRGRLDFHAIGHAALVHAPTVLRRWLPDGKVTGHEYSARNPRRLDRSAGSFKINLISGRWADFAVGAKGGDLISLAAYLFSIGQADAAMRIAEMLGVDHES
jgi:hypothetical protein